MAWLGLAGSSGVGAGAASGAATGAATGAAASGAGTGLATTASGAASAGAGAAASAAPAASGSGGLFQGLLSQLGASKSQPAMTNFVNVMQRTPNMTQNSQEEARNYMRQNEDALTQWMAWLNS